MCLIEDILVPAGSGAMRTADVEQEARYRLSARASRKDPAFVREATATAMTRVGKRMAMHRSGLPEIEAAG